MAELLIDYKPTSKQLLFHMSTANEILFGGAAGGGKSKAIVMDAFARCYDYPETHAYCFRRTYMELEDTLIKEAKASYPKSLAKYNVGRHDMELVNGSVIHFRHCASMADMYNYAGAEIHWLYLDELTSFEQEIYEFLRTRLRSKVTLGIVPVVRCASNPGNIGHSWVKEYFVDAGPYGQPISVTRYSETLKETFTFTKQYIPALAMENPHITKEYILELERKPSALKRALLNGDWDAFEGKVFMEFVNEPLDELGLPRKTLTHVIKPFIIPNHWPRFMSFDHGFSRPFSVGWWAVGPDGTAYRYKEWYGCEQYGDQVKANTGLKLTPQQISAGIVAREREETEENIYVRRICDPAIFDKSRGRSVADQMEPTSDGGPGVYFEAGDNSRIAGKMQLHERFRFRDDGRPRLQVFDTCKQWIRTINALPYSLVDPEDVDTNSEDHAYDDTRYFLMSNPLPVDIMTRKTPRTFDPYADVDTKNNRRGLRP